MPELFQSRPELTAFKPVYETKEEADLRLLETVIEINGQPFMVSQITRVTKRGITMKIWDSVNVTEFVVTDDNPVDFRTPESRYVMHRGEPYYLCRRVSRKYRQGLTAQNTALESIMGAARLDHTHAIVSLLRSPGMPIEKSTIRMIEAGYITGHPVSRHLALRKCNAQMVLEYRGRKLADIHGDTATLSKEDAAMPWIVAEVQKCPFTIKVQ